MKCRLWCRALLYALTANWGLVFSGVMAAVTLSIAFYSVLNGAKRDEEFSRVLVIIERNVSGPLQVSPSEAPDPPGSVAWRLDLLRAENMVDSALKLVDSAIRVTPDAALYWRRGQYHRATRQRAYAIADFDSAIRMDPALLSARVWQGLAYAESADAVGRGVGVMAGRPVWKKALSVYDKAFRSRWSLRAADRLLLESFRWEARRALGLVGKLSLGQCWPFLLGYLIVAALLALSLVPRHKQEFKRLVVETLKAQPGPVHVEEADKSDAPREPPAVAQSSEKRVPPPAS
jgi:tetratricopeptide (TPR) repeat protein